MTNEQLPYHVLKAHMKDIGEITGFKDVARPYCLRYGAANAFDKDGTSLLSVHGVVR
jgi:hypothetical protein